MAPYDYKKHFIAAVVKRSGICRASVEQVLPAVFDEIRYQLSEGARCVAIESFGTFAIQVLPERTRTALVDGRRVAKKLPPKEKLKFGAARCLRNDVEAHCFDPTRRAFTHHPKDPKLRLRGDFKYNRRRPPCWPTNPVDDPEDPAYGES